MADRDSTLWCCVLSFCFAFLPYGHYCTPTIRFRLLFSERPWRNSLQNPLIPGDYSLKPFMREAWKPCSAMNKDLFTRDHQMFMDE